MYNMRVGSHRRTPSGSPRTEVGEIDTRAPFQSVKAAVSLFGEVSVKGKPSTVKKSKLSSENVLDKETQLLLAQRELTKMKQQLESAETTKARAFSELEKAKITVQDLSTKLKTVSESKQSAIAAKEAVKEQAKQLEVENSNDLVGSDNSSKKELDEAREQYAIVAAELDAVKQDLTKMRQDFDAALEVKLAAFQQAGEAQHSAKANQEKVSELSKQIAAMQESINHLKLASIQSQEKQAKIVEERDALLETCRIAKEEAENKLLSLKSEFDPEATSILETKFAETTAEIEVIQEEMKKAHAADMNLVKVVTLELDEATKELQKVAEEESSLRSLVASLRLELDNVKKVCAELMEEEVATESIAQNLRVELENSKAELEAILAEAASDELNMTLQQLSSETESAILEAEEMKKTAEDLKQEAEAAQAEMEETEEKLQIALIEAQEAKAAEKNALAELQNMSSAQAMNPNSGSKIKLTKEEYESMSRKHEEAEHLAEMKVAAAMFQVGAINASNNEAMKRLEASLREIDELKAATEENLKKAEMAEAAKKAIEGELHRLRQEQKPSESSP